MENQDMTNTDMCHQCVLPKSPDVGFPQGRVYLLLRQDACQYLPKAPMVSTKRQGKSITMKSSLRKTKHNPRNSKKISLPLLIGPSGTKCQFDY